MVEHFSLFYDFKYSMRMPSSQFDAICQQLNTDRKLDCVVAYLLT